MGLQTLRSSQNKPSSNEEIIMQHDQDLKMELIGDCYENLNNVPSDTEEVRDLSPPVLSSASMEEKPLIQNFQVFIGSSEFESSSQDSVECISILPHFQSKRQNQDSFTSDTDSKTESLLLKIAPQKSVRFTEDTVFIERDMDSPFWTEFRERKIRRKQFKEQRLKRNNGRSLTLFDLMKLIFVPRKQTFHVSKENIIEVESVEFRDPGLLDNSNWKNNSNRRIRIRSTGTRVQSNAHLDLKSRPGNSESEDIKEHGTEKCPCSGSADSSNRLQKMCSTIRTWWNKKFRKSGSD